MKSILMVFLGGGAGAACRHLVGLAALRALGPNFPWGTLIVNVAGSLVMGAFIEFLVFRMPGHMEIRLLVATGFLGGFTTFSAFSLDFLTLWQRGEHGVAMGYVGASVVLSLLAVFVGAIVTRAILQ